MNRSENKDLTTQNITDNTRYMQKCRGHNELLQYVCENCRTLLCELCIPESHNGHNCFHIDDFLTHRNDDVVYHLIKTGKLAWKCLKSIGLKEVDHACYIDNNCNKLAQRIRNTFRPLISALERRERSLLDIVNTMHKNRMESMYERIYSLRPLFSGIIASTKKLNKLISCGYKLDNLYVVAQILEVQREVDNYAKLYRENQYIEEKYVFCAPQFLKVMLEDIENMGSIELKQNSPSDIFYNPDIFEDLIDQNTQFPSLNTIINDEAQPEKETGANIGIGQAMAGNFKKVLALYSDTPTSTFAPKGNGDGYFGRPWGVCVNKSGHILVTDRRNHNVQVLDANGQFKYKFGQKGSSNGQFNAPSGICVDKNSRIIIADKNNHRIQVFASGGIHILSFGSLGSECGNLKFPFDVSVNSNLQIVVSDTANHRIQQFEPNGDFIREIPLGICKFTGYDITPRGICYTPNGNIIITDYTNHCLHLIDPEKEEIIRTKGNQGSGYSQFSSPSGVCCDDVGKVIVADCHNHRICVLSQSMESLWNIDVRPSVNCLPNTYCDETDRTCDVALTKEGHIVFVTEMLLTKEASNTTKHFVHIY